MHNLKMPERKQISNKGTFGKVLNIAGSENYVGAAYLSSLGVLKIGAGYVAIASCDKVLNSVSQMLPEAVYLTRKKAKEELLNYTVMLIGCGIGTDKKAKKDFFDFIKFNCDNADIPIVIDADGLNILSQNKELKLPSKTIITPHPAEAARLLGTTTENILADVESSAKKLTEKYKCTTVLKTHRTVICSQNFEISVNQHGNSALAKAGTGDVLAGIISGLLAQKMSEYEAAKLGVYLHSRAGEIASENMTEYSVLASDIPDYLPCAIKEII